MLPPAALRLQIDTEALSGNWRALNALSGQAVAGAAVKADAYGLGSERVAATLLAAGCKDFFVAHWSEVPAVLRHVPPEAIAVLHGPNSAEDVRFALETGVRPVLNSLHQIGLWRQGGGGLCHVMVDSGMNRLGLEKTDLSSELLSDLQIDICMSHLASADEDTRQNEEQLAAFAQLRSAIAARRYSLANSAGIALGSAFHADLTRPGIALYGGIARSELAGHVKQVARPEAAVLQVRTLQAGDKVGYNALFQADRQMRVGTLAIGYADGFLRCWTGHGCFRWQGRSAPTLGRISMDLTIVDLSDLPDCREGDWLTAEYDLPSSARSTGLSQYELLTLLGRRFARPGA